MPEFYAYEASLHCPAHAFIRFGARLNDPKTTDGEGNPIGAVFSWELQGDECCDECVAAQVARRCAFERGEDCPGCSEPEQYCICGDD